MSQSQLIPVFATVLGTVLGAIIHYVSSRKSAEEASQRIFEKRAADSKFERLEELHDSLDDCRRQFREVIVQGPHDISNYIDRVREPYDEFKDAFTKAKIHLDSEQRETVESTLETFNEHRTELKMWAMEMDDDYADHHNFDIQNLSRDELEEASESVFDMIRSELNPDAED